MDKNRFIGFTLLLGIFFIWLKMNAPTEAEIVEQKRLADSTELVQHIQDSLANLPADAIAGTVAQEQKLEEVPDSVRQIQNSAKFGSFSPSGSGTDTDVVIENDKMKITFSSKGAKIKEVVLKEYSKIIEDSNHVDVKLPLVLLEDTKNKFNYSIPVSNSSAGIVNSEDLYFTPKVNGKTVVFTAKTNTGGSFEQVYALGDDYGMDYDIRLNNLNNVMSQGAPLRLEWINFLDKIEKNPTYEAMYSTVVFKESGEGTDNCSYTGDDVEKVEKLKWVTSSNQFFNSSLVADESFSAAEMEIKTLEKGAKDLKESVIKIDVPISNPASSTFGMKMYIGPNEFDTLKAYEADLDDVVPYGWSIFGTINRWVVRPIYRFIHGFIGNVGIAILLLTLLVKLIVYPLTYKMLYSQSKMAALKPRLAKLKEKHGDDTQTIQMETMKLYREFGVNPLGGCFPMLIQMPIWYALFRFFPASIDFRQASFLWATDLSSYDVAWRLPMDIPFYGDHVSLFTILWALTTVIYTYYNSKHMDMSANPAMKYMQYMMPVMFLFFFNSYAAGLTVYMLFSNVFNILQTVVTKNFIIDNEKIERELSAYKAKPKKKKSGFSAKLQEAMEKQKKLQEEAEKNKKKKK